MKRVRQLELGMDSDEPALPKISLSSECKTKTGWRSADHERTSSYVLTAENYIDFCSHTKPSAVMVKNNGVIVHLTLEDFTRLTDFK